MPAEDSATQLYGELEKRTCDNCKAEFWFRVSCRNVGRFCKRACCHDWMRGREKKPLWERFWEKVEKGDQCWIYKGSHGTGNLYGQFRIRGKELRAHRLAWQFAFGPIPKGLNVLHSCDNPPCVRPDHLFLGTQLDNIHDMMRKGRAKMSGRPKSEVALPAKKAARSPRP